MMLSLWALVAAAMPPCGEHIQADLRAVDAALVAVEPHLLAIVDVPAREDMAVAFVHDDGRWVIRNSHMPATCQMNGIHVAEKRLWPLPGSGSMSLFTEQSHTAPILAIGTHDEARDGWDLIGWQAIVTHEWLHMGHVRALGDAFPDLWKRHKLTRRFGQGGPVRDTAVALVDALAKPCDAPVATAWAAHLESAPRSLRSLARDYVVIEGFARYAEIQYEARARGQEPGPDLCRGVADNDYGYAIGCMVAERFARCDGHVDLLMAPAEVDERLRSSASPAP